MRAPVRSIAFVLAAITAATVLGWLWRATSPLPATGELPADTKAAAPQFANGSLADATDAGDARTLAAEAAERPANADAPPQTQWLRVVDGITRARSRTPRGLGAPGTGGRSRGSPGARTGVCRVRRAAGAVRRAVRRA
ncbi:MAG: hypothetical protein ACK5UQ_16865, partial [Planctomycetota bacterium]